MTGPDFSKRLAEVAEQPNGGAAAAAGRDPLAVGGAAVRQRGELRRFAERAPVGLIVDSFRCDIPFGTGGRRGRVGIGPNRINPRTLALTVAGHCEFLRADVAGRSGGRTVVVANDTRVFTDINAAHTFMGDDWSLLGTSSRSLALLACQIYAVYGFETYLTAPKDHDAYMPTPELSFAISELGAAGGLNVSASHNHPDDNGFKVYTPTGGQYCPPDDATLSRAVEQVELDPRDRAAGRPATPARPRRSPPTCTAPTSACTSSRYAAICASSAAVRVRRADRLHAAVRHRAGQRGRDADRGRIPGARAARPVPGRLVRADPAALAEPGDPRRDRPGDRVRRHGRGRARAVDRPGRGPAGRGGAARPTARGGT